MKHYAETIERVLTDANTSPDGLTAEEASRRLEKNGPNKLREAERTPLIARFLAQLKDPMIFILIAAAVVSGVTSIYANESVADVFIILFVVIVNAILGVYQENKAEHAIEALRGMTAATSKVIRGGHLVVVRTEDLVVGDVVQLEAGDAVPADGRVIECASLQTEEAALTGESLPVTKTVDALDVPETQNVPLGDRRNMVYMGSSAAYGRGRFAVTATGMETEVGRIAGALAEAKESATPLQIRLKQLSKTLSILVLAVCAAVFIVGLLRGGTSSEHLIDTFMVAVSLAVAAIPEGLVAVVTIVLSIGVTRMSKKRAIIRKLTAVETLGCAQIICSDKTGTLTQNKMTVVEFDGDAHLLMPAMALCCDSELNADGTATGEPTENALVEWANKNGVNRAELKKTAPRVGEAPFDSVRKMMSTVHERDGKVVQYTKGALDCVLDLCTTYLHDGKAAPMTDESRADILRRNKGMTSRALRVLAAAVRTHDGVPADVSPANLERDMCFVGFTGMIDPVRPEVKDAIEHCRAAGIRPIMITGDHVDTASAIAQELGMLEGGREAVSGVELETMDDATFNARFMNIAVYARVQPEHKTRIVNAWRNAGYVTAMTGDGVNDAPSIKAADIGVGMGITGTDVTKNVADMVLSDDNFATIVGAVEEGRRIYDNIRRVIQFLFSSNLSEVLGVFFASLIGFTLLKPVHLLWINLVTDCMPALALGVEEAEPGIMKRPARSPLEGVFADGLGFDAIYQGIMVAILTLAAYFIGIRIETGAFAFADSAHGMTMAFLTMSLAEVFHSLNLRSRRASIFSLKSTNRPLLLAAFGSLVCTLAVVMIPPVAQMFSFAVIGLHEILIALALAVCVIPLVEFVKMLQRKRIKK